MAKINVLDSKTYNKIAAGEVVERPASVVKELVENSIDAGAKNIKIDIKNGGITSIKITDDGSGIESEELPKTILAHATSKLSTIDDLTYIKTLGFRGEALASIASVSKFKIVSKPRNQQNGAMLYCEGGVDLTLSECASFDGTEITVEDLFFNVPARQKFLKTIRSEENEITNIVFRLILGYPDVSIKYTADDKVIYHSFGDGFDGAMLAVYGLDTINNCVYIDQTRNGIRIYGYISKINFVKGTRTHQTIYVNGRYVTDSTVSVAIANAYIPFMMNRKFPFYVVNVVVPPEIVDVNVHPTKSEVRFSNGQIIYGSIYHVIYDAITGHFEPTEVFKDKTEDVVINEELKGFDSKEQVVKTDFDAVLFDKGSEKEKSDFTVKLDELVEQKNEKDNEFNDIFEENKRYLAQLEAKKEKIKEIQQEIEGKNLISKEIDEAVSLEYVGQVLNTFLILQDGNNVYFVDQHAAHERILYDKLIDKLNSKDVTTQPLLIPYVLNLTGIECDFLVNKLPFIKKLGFEIEEFGKNSFKISALPLDLVEINLTSFFDDVLGDMAKLNDALPEILTEKLASKACKAAIKAGQKLSKIEIDTLLTLLKGNLGLKCPHGRPIAIKITRTEIDKWFKRII